MSDHVHIMKETRKAVLSSRPAYLSFARSVSTLLGPAIVSVPLVLLVAFYHSRDPRAALSYASLTLFFLSVGPLGYILLGVRLGKLSDLDVSRRAERTGPFLFGLFSVTLGLFALLSLHAPKNLETVMITTAASGFVMVIITWWWKISIHAATLAGSLTMLTALYGVAMLPAFVLLVLVSWSRVMLRRHTIAQVIAGSLVSVVLTSAVLLMRGV